MRLNGGDLIEYGKPVSQTYNDADFTVEVLADGTQFGTLEPLTKTLNTLMTQGSLEVVERFENRQPGLAVRIAGRTPAGVNAGEMWLSSLMGPGVLEWLPPDQTVWTCFDVVRSHLGRSYDGEWDLDEHRWERTYEVPIKALPYARSQFRAITPALPLASTPLIDELVNNGSSLTGWSASEVYDAGTRTTIPRTPSVVVGTVRVASTVERFYSSLQLRYTLAAPLPAETPILRFDMLLSNTSSALIRSARVGLESGASVVVPAAQVYEGVDGEVTAYFRPPVGAVWVEVDANMSPDDGGEYGPASFSVDEVRRQSRLFGGGAHRQKVAAISPGGSAPAEGSLHVWHPDAGLGKVIVATYPIDRPSPALMQYRTASTPATPDSTQINGERVLIQDDDLVLTVPDPLLPSHGLAALWAKVQVDIAPATVTWTLVPTIGGVAVGQVQTESVVIPAGAEQVVPLGLVTLPGAAMARGGAVVITLRRTAGAGLVSVDEAWPFAQDEASALLIVDCGTGSPAPGGPANHLWVNAPSADKPAGEVLVGTDPTNAHWPAAILAGPDIHRFGRDGAAVTTVTCGATDASSEFEHFMRWTHHAAKSGGDDS